MSYMEDPKDRDANRPRAPERRPTIPPAQVDGVTYFPDPPPPKRVPPQSMLFLNLDAISEEDVSGLRKAQESYGDSWKKRGGVGAFMMLARKWDRIELQLSRSREGANSEFASAYDIFTHAQFDTRTEGLIDDIRDLRRYLLLVEAELRVQGIAHGKHRDNQ